jgi:hypothetical protein
VQGANIVIQDIDRALDNITKNPISTTGLIGKGLSYIGGTKSADLDSLLTTIKSNAGFDKLQAMRNASPTGGALGNVSNEENKLLAAAIGALEQSQSPQQLQDNLRRVKNIYSDIIHGHGNGPKREVLSFEQQSQQSPQGGGPQVGQIINGYRYKGGNPNDQSSYEKVQ